jgi:hypothetical protein
MLVSRKTFGVIFHRGSFWGCIEDESQMAWDKIFKTDEGFVTKAKWLRLCKEIYKIRVKEMRTSGYGREDSHYSGMNTLYTFVSRTPEFMFPKVRNSEEFSSKYDMAESLNRRNGTYRMTISPILKSLSATFDKLQKAEIKLRKEQK